MSELKFDYETILNIQTSLLEVWEELGDKRNFSLNARNSLAEYMRLRHEMSKETDRGVALFATAQIEDQLKELLYLKLAGSKSHKRKLFTNNGPLGTFSSRIAIAYSVGFISKTLKEEIDIIRKIRNIFAHSKDIIDFNSQEIDSLCKSLNYAIPPNKKDNRQLFITSLSGVSGTLAGTTEQQEEFKEFSGQDLYHRKKEYLDILSKLGLINTK